MKLLKFAAAIGLSVAFLSSPQLCLAQEDCTPFLQTDKDKFTGQITIYTPLMEPLVLNKIILKGAEYYYLRIEVNGSTVTVGRKGVYVLFSDGTKFVRPDEEIDTKVNTHGSGYNYTCFAELKKSDLELFSKKTITDVKLYIYEREIGTATAEKFKCGVTAIIKAK